MGKKTLGVSIGTIPVLLMKLLYLFPLFAIQTVVHSKPDNVVTAMVVNYHAMYQNECIQPTPTASSDHWEKYENAGSGKYSASNKAFCACLRAEEESKVSFEEKLNGFIKCMETANSKDQVHWEKVAKRYEHKFSANNPDSWETPTEIPSIATTENKQSEEEATYYSLEGTVSTLNEDNVELMALSAKSESSTNDAAVYVTFIGSSVLLFICAWFVKGTLKKWKMREYKHVNPESEAEANQSGNPYDDHDVDTEWDDNYDLNYAKNDRADKKGKFSAWNQYSAV